MDLPSILFKLCTLPGISAFWLLIELLLSQLVTCSLTPLGSPFLKSFILACKNFSPLLFQFVILILKNCFCHSGFYE